MKKIIEIDVEDGEAVFVLRGRNHGFISALFEYSKILRDMSISLFDNKHLDLGSRVMAKSYHVKEMALAEDDRQRVLFREAQNNDKNLTCSDFIGGVIGHVLPRFGPDEVKSMEQL